MSIPATAPTRPYARLALASAALCSLAACGSSSSETGAGPRPLNVLLITLDTTRADRLGCYGHAAARTPVIDKLASGGLRFERALSTAGITPMSHSSILTGLNNYDHGMRVFHSEEVSHRLKDEVNSMPEILGAEGWRTGASISAYPVSEPYNLNQGFDRFESGVLKVDQLNLAKQQSHKTFWGRGGATVTQRAGDQTVDDAIDFIGPEGSEQPWALWVHLFDAHDFSIVPPADFLDSLGVECPPEGTRTQGKAQHEWRERMYDPELAYIDTLLGRMVDHLEDIGELDSTVIVITADHGQGLLDGLERHNWGKHRLLYDWSLHVPMILHVPGEAPAVIGDQVRTIDVLPTVLEALNFPPAEGIEGLSMLPLARGATEPKPRIAYADALNLHDSHSPPLKALGKNYDNLYCATDGVWKYIFHEEQPANSELFHLAEDPLELSNLYAAEHPQAKRLHAFLDERKAWNTEKPTAGSGGNAASLQSLGYGGGGSVADPADDDVQEGEKKD